MGAAATEAVLLELKDARHMTRLIEQVESYASLMIYARVVVQLYTARLGFEVRFGESTEKWIVWPALGLKADPREAEPQTLDIFMAGDKREGRASPIFLGIAALRIGLREIEDLAKLLEEGVLVGALGAAGLQPAIDEVGDAHGQRDDTREAAAVLLRLAPSPTLATSVT